MNKSEATAFLESYLPISLEPITDSTIKAAYQTKYLEALQALRPDPPAKPTLIKRVDIDPDGNLDDIARALEDFHISGGNEITDYLGVLIEMWVTHQGQYVKSNPKLYKGMEDELRANARFLYDEYRLVTTYTPSGHPITDYEAVATMPLAQLTIVQKQLRQEAKKQTKPKK
jgi:hypothetical protein